MAEKIADAGLIENFKSKVREWWLNVEKLRSMKVPADKQKQKNDLLSRAETIRKSIKNLTSWSDTLKITELGNIGFLPLIPVAVIGGAVAAIGYWANDYAKFAKTINYQKMLVNQGIPPAEAAALANKQSESGSLLGGMTGLIKWVAFAGAGYMLYTKFLKKG